MKQLSRSLLVLLLIAAAGTAAAEDRIADLTRMLEAPEASYKVKLLTMAYLGRFRARRAVPALLRLLRSTRSQAVRRLAIATLGNIGDPAALPALVEISRRDRFRLGASARRAMRKIEEQETGRREQVYLTLGRFANRSRRGGRVLADMLRSALARGLRGEPTVVTDAGIRLTASDLGRRRLKGFLLDGSIVKLERRVRGTRQELACQIRVSVATYPGGSMKAFYRGEAAIDAPAWQPVEQLYREVIEGAAGEARKQILQGYLFASAPSTSAGL